MNRNACLCLVGLLLPIVGCSLKADPASDSGFFENPELLAERRERYPFNKTWISESFAAERDRFDKLVIRRVNLDYLHATGDWKHVQTISEEEVKEDAQEIAEYFEAALRKAFLGKENTRITVVNETGMNTLIMELAIIELIPTDVVRNVAGNVAGFFVPGGGLVSQGAGGSIAMEARMRAASSNEIVAKFKDREQAKIRPVDLKGLTAYGFARESIDDWASQAVELLNTSLDEKVEDSSAIKLRPW